MKKTIVTGVLAAALIATGGTGFYMVFANENSSTPAAYMKEQGIGFQQMKNSVGQGNFDNMQKFMEEQDIDFNEMNGMMESGDFEGMKKFMEEQNINFGQIKPYMKEMHPDLSNQDLEEMYKDMHGTGGSANSQNMSGNNL